MSTIKLREIHQKAIKMTQDKLSLTQIVNLANGTTPEQRQNQLQVIASKRTDLWQQKDYTLKVALEAANDLTGFRQLGYSDEAAYSEIKALWNRS